MPAIVEFPTVFKEALDEFGDRFNNDPKRKHFAEYLTGLMISNKKNVSTINRPGLIAKICRMPSHL